MDTIKAAEIMTVPAIVVAPETDVAAVASLLAQRHISAVPVCSADGKLVGLVSEIDLLRPYRESARLRRDWWLAQIAEGEELPEDFLNYLRHEKHTAADVMVRKVVTASETATLPELADLMVSRGVKRVPIVCADRVVGIVSRSDLVAALARTPSLVM